MQNKLNSIIKPLLMGPGPSCVSDSVYQAIAQPTLGHLDTEFIALMDDIKSYIRKLIHTENHLTVPISGTGSAGMEACFVNLVEPGDRVLVLINGVFGVRMEDVASRLGAKVDSLKFEWGTPVILNSVREKLAQKKYNLVAVVHAETSTGVCNPVSEIGKLVKDNGALYLVDCVTSMGGIELEMDEWQIDALYSGTQKCLSCPPGLSPVSFSDLAVEKLNNRKSKVPNWYLDLSMITKYWSGKARVYHHTAPINMLYGLYQSCYSIIEEGLENVLQRHKDMHELLVSELKTLGLELFVEESVRLPMLNAVKIPSGVDDANLREKLINDYRIEIGGGLGPLAGKIWRIGLMGETAKKENIHTLIGALKNILH